MTLTIDISPEVKARLETAAAMHGQQPEDHLRMVVENHFAPAREKPEVQPTDWDALTRLLDKCQFDGGDPGLASRYNHDD